VRVAVTHSIVIQVSLLYKDTLLFLDFQTAFKDNKVIWCFVIGEKVLRVFSILYYNINMENERGNTDSIMAVYFLFALHYYKCHVPVILIPTNSLKTRISTTIYQIIV